MTDAPDSTPATQTGANRGRGYRRLAEWASTEMETFRNAARIISKTGLLVSAGLATTWLALIGVYTSIHIALTQHDLDPATATSLGEGINDALEHLNPFMATTIISTVWAMIAAEILTHTIRNSGPLTTHAGQPGEVIRVGKKQYLIVNGADGNLTLAPLYTSNLRDDWKARG